MSELTRCNACSLKDIEARAKARGAHVAVERIPVGTGDSMEGWYQVNVSDKEEPVAYFMELTAECCC